MVTRLRLLVVIGSSDIGGAERSSLTVLGCLDPERFEVSIACAGRGPMLAEYRCHAGAVWPLDALDIGKPSGRAGIAAVIAEIRPHIVHTHLWSADAAAGLASRLARVPVLVSTVHGAYHVPLGVRGAGRIRREVQSFVYRLVYRWFDAIVAVSSYVRDDLIRRRGVRVPADRIHVVHNAIAVPCADRASPPSPDTVRAGRPGLIVNVANFFPGKGHDCLLRAIPAVLAEFPEARCVLVGDGPERPAMEALADRLGIAPRVTFEGRIPDPAGVLAAGDVVVLPSLSEGLPRVVLEALGLGKPVVATRVGGIPEIIEDGRTGLLVSPDDPGALAAAVSQLWRDPAFARRLGDAGREEVRSRFSVEQAVRQTERLYLDLARAKGVLR